MTTSTPSTSSTPVITELRVVPVAGHDSMLMNLSGAHGPFFTRNLIILRDSAGNTGVGEVPGGEKIRQTIEDARALIVGRPIGHHNAVLNAMRAQFADRDAGGRGLQTFDLPLALSGTPFRLRVWAELQTIPYGRTLNYGELAARLGSRAKARAVGGAAHANPVAIIVPCHRLIGANGSLTGFGGGLPLKQALLDLERDHPGPEQRP